MSNGMTDIEGLLRQALAPVEPPDDLRQRLDGTLQNLATMAAEELEAWELESMRDPRNWLRPVVAAGVGTAAGAALVVLRVHGSRKKRRAAATDPLNYVEQTARAAVDEARRLLDR